LIGSVARSGVDRRVRLPPKASMGSRSSDRFPLSISSDRSARSWPSMASYKTVLSLIPGPSCRSDRSTHTGASVPTTR